MGDDTRNFITKLGKSMMNTTGEKRSTSIMKVSFSEENIENIWILNFYMIISYTFIFVIKDIVFVIL